MQIDEEDNRVAFCVQRFRAECVDARRHYTRIHIHSRSAKFLCGNMFLDETAKHLAIRIVSAWFIFRRNLAGP